MRKGVFAAFCLILGLACIAGCAGTHTRIANAPPDPAQQQVLHQLHEDAYVKKDKQAILKLGAMFETGSGGERRNLYSALALYDQLAYDGDLEGEMRIANLYLWGFKDYADALEWLQKAEAQGSGAADYYLGYMYQNGFGVERDQQQADTFYKKSFLTDDDMQRQWLYFDMAVKGAVLSPKTSTLYTHGNTGGIAVIEFDYVSGDKAENVKVRQPSGDSLLDAEALRSVAAATLPPKPPGMEKFTHFIVAVHFGS